MTGRRARAEKAGRIAEAAAALWLTVKGYRILARRVRTPAGEIDLVAWHRAPGPKGTLCFIEVKWRPSLGEALVSIGPRQRERLARAAEAFLQLRPALAGAQMRFDVLLLAPNSWPRHMRDAWRV